MKNEQVIDKLKNAVKFKYLTGITKDEKLAEAKEIER